MIWKYTNNTTGSDMECNNLPFMIHELRNIREIPVPTSAVRILKDKGESTFQVEDTAGILHDITLRSIGATMEHSLLASTGS